MHYKLIACEIFFREFCATVARSSNKIDLEFLPKGLHDIGQEKMSAQLKQAIERVDESQYDAILLGYGLCNNGIVGLKANTIPLVVPRAHDCITLFLGNKDRYDDYFHSHVGTYYITSGWIERGNSFDGALSPQSIQSVQGLQQSYEALVEKYGEENAQYLYGQLYDLTKHYKQMTYIEMGVEPDNRFEEKTQSEAKKRNWIYEKIQGNLSLFQRLLDGDWDDRDFLVVPPGSQISADYSDDIIKTEDTSS